MWLYLPQSVLMPAMAFEETEPVGDIVMHCMAGLKRLDLVDYAHWGDAEHVNVLNKKLGWCSVTEWGITIEPTQFGIDYWLWAVGAGSVSRVDFLRTDLQVPKLPEITLPPGIIKLASKKA